MARGGEVKTRTLSAVDAVKQSTVPGGGSTSQLRYVCSAEQPTHARVCSWSM
ncbi:Hypothetical protein SMAX5B_014419 [Scophthalmus maximus]|uniref:Uncharacterized protein n=1 Tax=Scophthalmus maximus TaxID=52904 RepID=A0A2U9CCF0_SCOMX|nr:Hypothetical protein SMAX5B_014419 [Scophthalmus maximus]